MRRMHVLGFSAAVLLAASCGQTAQRSDDAILPTSSNQALTLDRSPGRVTGSFHEDGVNATFSSVAQDGGIIVNLELNGIRLTSRTDADGNRYQTGINLADGSPAVMTDMDRRAVARILSALEAEERPPLDVTTKAEYDATFRRTPVEERLFRVLDVSWSQWPSTQPLDEVVLARDAARSYSQKRYYATAASWGPNDGYTGTHDCNSCDRWTPDCMDTWPLGGYDAGDSQACNYGNCGTSCSGTQYTNDCVDHDQCVRTAKHGGHVLASAWCDDEFISATDDELFAPSCDYDWRGTSRQGNCPTSWDGARDGCDCFCQFRDNDCL